MQNLKTQFEIRYSTLLNFNTEYKSIFSPYLKICEFNLHNINTIEEYIVLTFKKEKFSIDCRWDRIVFVSEGIRDDLKKSQGPLFYFFEILDKLKSLPTFGKIQNILLVEWNLIEYDYELENLKEKFRKSFLSNKLLKPATEIPTEDFSVTYTYGDENEKFQRYTFGPFVQKRDIINYDLLPISRKLTTELESKKGIFSESFYFEKTSQGELDSYKKASRTIELFLNEIKLDE